MATDYREYNLSYTAEEVDDKLGIINTSKNLLPYPYIVGSLAPVNGLTFVDNGDGSITVNGSITNPSTAKTIRLTTLSLPAGTYTASGSSDNTKVFLRVTFGNTSYSIFSTATFTVTENTSVAVDLYIEGNSGEVLDIQNITIKPQIEQGDTFTGWEPYIESINSYVYNHFEGLTKKVNDKLSASDLDSAVEDALLKAKQTGEFDGKDGQDGEDGTSVNHTWSGTTLIVTSASGTTSADLKGDKGDKGDRGEKGDTGNSNIYIGTGEMPEGYEVQIDPTADPDLITGQTINDSENYFYNETVENALNQLGHSQIIDAGTFASTDEITSYNWEGNKFYKFTLNCYSDQGFSGDCIGLFDPNSAGGYIYFYNLTTGLSGSIYSKWGAGTSFNDGFTYSSNGMLIRSSDRFSELSNNIVSLETRITEFTEVNDVERLASYIETVSEGALFSVRFSSAYTNLPMYGRCLCIKLPISSGDIQYIQYLNLETGAAGFIRSDDLIYTSVFDPKNTLNYYICNDEQTFKDCVLLNVDKQDLRPIVLNITSDISFTNMYSGTFLLPRGMWLCTRSYKQHHASTVYIYVRFNNIETGQILEAHGQNYNNVPVNFYFNSALEDISTKYETFTDINNNFSENTVETALNELGDDRIIDVGEVTSVSALAGYANWIDGRIYKIDFSNCTTFFGTYKNKNLFRYTESDDSLTSILPYTDLRNIKFSIKNFRGLNYIYYDTTFYMHPLGVSGGPPSEYTSSAGIVYLRNYLNDNVHKLIEPAQKWNKLRFGFIGDSQTETNSHKSKKWLSWLREKLNFSGGTVCATSGYTIANNATSYGNFLSRAKDLPYASDVIFVFGGVNDVWFNTPLGEFGNVDNTTFYGAMDELCNYLLDKYPGKLIIFITPTEQNNDSCNTANTTGHTVTDFAEAMKKVCEKYSIPVYDAYSKSGIYPLNEKNASIYTTDKLHLNDEGHKRLGHQISLFIQNTCYAPEDAVVLTDTIGTTKTASYTNKSIYLTPDGTYAGVDLLNVSKITLDMSYYSNVSYTNDRNKAIPWFGFKQSNGSYIAVSPTYRGSNEGLNQLKGEEWTFDAALTTPSNHTVNLWEAPTAQPQLVEVTFDNGIGKIYFDSTEVYSVTCENLSIIASSFFGNEICGLTLTYTN